MLAKLTVILMILGHARASTKVAKAEVFFYPAKPVEGCPMTVICAAKLTQQVQVAFAWEYDGASLPHTDGTFVIANPTDATNGNNKNYKCTVNDVDGSADGTKAVTIVKNDVVTAKPVIKSSKGTVFYGDGESYTLTCGELASCSGMQYKWFSGGTAIGATGREHKVTASTTSESFTCKTVMNGVESLESNPEVVEGKILTDIKLIGPAAPVKTIATTYSCDAKPNKANENKINQITYAWEDSSGVISGETSQTLTKTFPTAPDGTYKCTATLVIGSTRNFLDASLPIAAVATPSTPTIVVAAGGVGAGEKVDLKCETPSEVATADWVWNFTPDGQNTTTTLAAGNGTVLTIASVGANDAGDYTCLMNISGTATPTSASYQLQIQHGLSCALTLGTCAGDPSAYSGICTAGVCQCTRGRSPEYGVCRPYGVVMVQHGQNQLNQATTTANSTNGTGYGYGYSYCYKGAGSNIRATYLLLIVLVTMASALL